MLSLTVAAASGSGGAPSWPDASGVPSYALGSRDRPKGEPMRLTRNSLAGMAGIAVLASFAVAGCRPATEEKAPAATPEAAAGKELKVVPDIATRVAQFAPTPLSADLSALT